MVERKTVSLRRLANGKSETIKFERWFRNKAVTTSDLIFAEQERIKNLVNNRHVLAIQDTTELNYQKHVGRVHGLGTVGNGKDVGFFMHPMFIMDADTDACLGISAVHLDNRLNGASEKYQELPIEEKESYRWISTAEKSKSILSQADCVTFIGDRENDIYEFIDRIPDEKNHFILRVKSNRILINNEEKLFSNLGKQPEAGRLTIKIQREIRKNRTAREAVLAIKYGEFEIKKSKSCTDKQASKSIKVWFVEVVEINCPDGEEPIHWRLMTTHMITNIDQAKQILIWYRKRWNIEQIFRTMKKQGLDVESSQMESAENLMKLSIMSLCTAIKITQLVLAREGTTQQKVEDVFTTQDQEILSAILKTIEGKTAKQKNPYPKENLAWASWIIARLGGWHGYIKSEGLPGPIVMYRGLLRFQGICDGWNLGRIMYAE
jgi:Transposase DDE domain